MKLSGERKRLFCDAIVRGLTPDSAAQAIGVGRTTVYRWKRNDPAFAEQWREAWDRKVEVVENVLYRMAVEKDLGAVIFFLKSHKPEVYNRRQVVAIGGDPDNPLLVHRTGDPDEVVHFYMPSNGRDRPKVIDAPTLDGKVEDAA
jgi:hypothetical protein